MKPKKDAFQILVINHPNGAKQIIKPNMHFFDGDWYGLFIALFGVNCEKAGFTYQMK